MLEEKEEEEDNFITRNGAERIVRGGMVRGRSEERKGKNMIGSGGEGEGRR